MKDRRNSEPGNGSQALAFLLLAIMFLVLGLIAFSRPVPTGEHGASRLNTCTTDTECERMYGVAP